MAIRKTHVRSDKRKKREHEQAAIKEAARKKSKKPILGRKQKTTVETSFRFKSQSERYKDISVDLKSLLDDAVERYGRYDVQEKPEEAASDDEEEDMISSPMATALSELALLNTSQPFQALQRQLYSLTRSLPLVVHHRHKIARALVEAMTNPNRLELALSASHTVDLLPAFIQSLSPDPNFQLLEFDTILSPLMLALVSLALDPPALNNNAGGDRGNDPHSQTEISKRAFQVLAWTFREIGGDLVNKGNILQRSTVAWSWVSEGLTKSGVSRPAVTRSGVEVGPLVAPSKEDEVLLQAVESDRHDDLLEDLPNIDEEMDKPSQGEAAMAEYAAEDTAEVDNELDDPEDVGEGDELEVAPISRRQRPTSSIKPHLRRILATCFAFLVRKASPGKALDTLMGTLMDELTALAPPDEQDRCEEAIAWIFIESSKSVEGHIHSKGPAIFKAFISSVRERKVTPGAAVVNAALTALLHGSTAPHLASLIDAVLAGFKNMTMKSNDSFSVDLDLQMAATVVGTRKGTKLSDNVKEDLLVRLEHISQELSSIADRSLMESFVQLSTKCLLAAPSLEIMLSKGRKLLERICQLPRTYSNIAAACIATLSHQRWAYFGDFAAPLLGTLKPHMEETAYLTLSVKLVEDGNVASGKTVLRVPSKDMAEALRAWLRVWKNGKITPRQTKHALDYLILWSVPAVGGEPTDEATQALIETVRAVLENTENKKAARADFQETAMNACLILAACIKALDRAQSLGMLQRADVLAILEKYGWHRLVLSALSDSYTQLEYIGSLLDDTLLKVSISSFVDLQAAKTALQAEILSEDSLIRGSAIKICTHISPASEILRLCAEVEDIPLTIQNAREKAIAVRKIGMSASRSTTLDVELELALQYLIAVLKINFKPLWTEAASAIAILAKGRKSADLADIWAVVFGELQKTTNALAENTNLDAATDPRWIAGDAKAAPSEKSISSSPEFICTNNRRIDKTFADTMRDLEEEGEREGYTYGPEQIGSDRLHLYSYEEQLLKTCAEISNVTEKHSRDFVALFLSHFGKESASDSTAAGGKAGRARLSAWLEVFTRFKNPKAQYQAEAVYQQHLQNLSHGDNQIQKLALDCVLTWNSPNLAAHSEHLHNLLDSDKFRDQLLEFSLAEESDVLLPQRRPEVVPILIRILYGLMSSRQGRAAAVHVQKGRKAAIMATLRGCTPDELDTLIDLMLGPFEDLHDAESGFDGFAQSPPSAQTSVQLGFLSLCEDVLKYLGEKIEARWHDLLSVILNLAYHAQVSETAFAEGAPKKRVRQLALRRLSDFFAADPIFDYGRYMAPIFEGLVSPRLPKFAEENLQAPSALLELIITWSADSSLVLHLIQHDQRLLPAVYACLGAPSVKDSVVSRVLVLVQNLLRLSQDQEDSRVKDLVILPNLSSLLPSLAQLLARKAGTLNVREELGIRQIRILAGLAPFITDSNAAKLFVPILLPLFRKPNALLPEHVKFEMLEILRSILVLAVPQDIPRHDPSSLYTQAYETVSSLFGTLRTRNTRVKLVETFQQFAVIDAARASIVGLLEDLNAFSTRRIEEPDFDRRLPAFTRLNDAEYRGLESIDWIPIIHNMFFFIQDPEELSIRSNANLALRRFVEVAGPSLDPNLRTVFAKVFLPSLKTGLKSKVEMVRIEVLAVMSTAVQASTGVAELEEMKCLLADGDSEANFFNNVYHVQVHRRGRALRRLAEEVEAGSLSGTTAADIFIPLLGYNLTSISENKQADLVNETVQSIARMAKHVPWSPYNRMLQHYLKLASEKLEGQKVFLRTAVAILRSFHFDLNADAAGVPSKLLPNITQRLLPRLMQYLEARDSADEALRIPMAEGIASVLHWLPEDDKMGDVTNLVTALAQILKSKAQDVRDLARATLVNIAGSLGAPYLDVVLKELRAALTRGPQLHVLAFTLHALLIRLAAVESVNFDNAADNAAAIIYDDVFGQPSKDRESSEFRSKTKVKEVRSFKSLDSMEILAKNVSPACVNRLVGPLRDVIAHTESFKTMQDVDDTLRRIAAGLQVNPAVDNETLLSLCHSLISQNTDFLKPRKAKKQGKGVHADYHVQMKRTTVSVTDHYAQNAFRFVSFGLDILNGAFRKNRFDLRDTGTIAMLEPIIKLVGEALYADEAHVLERALRATASLVRCPLQSIDRAGMTLVKQIISVLEHCGTTSSEMAQTAIRTLATIIRERKTVTLKDEQLSYLLSLISQDLEEVEQQPALFALLRAITSRAFVVPEIYDLMDKVGEILVINQTSGTREICRSIYLQFLLDYPQGKKRLSASMDFLAKNLGSYAHESGRTSVLELVNAILSKFTTTLLDQYAVLFFASLTMDMVNDESAKCREMAAENVKVLVRRVGSDTRAQLLDMIDSWASSSTQKQLQRVAVQDIGLVLEAGLAPEDLNALAKRTLPCVRSLLVQAAKAFEADLDGAEESGDSLDWQLPYHALRSFSKIYKVSPVSLSAADGDLWQAVRSLLLFGHVWVRNAAARLMAIYFVAGHTTSTEDLVDAASKSALQLRSKVLDDSLSLQVVRNLFSIAKIFAGREQSVPNGLSNGNEVAADGAGEDHEDDDDDGRDPASQGNPTSDPFHWLFVKLSHRARVAHQTRPSMYSAEGRDHKWSAEPAAILRWFGAVISEESISAELLQKQKQQIMIPLVRIIEDPNGAKDPQLDELQNLAREVQELLSTKIGVTSVAEVYSDIRRKMTMRREERKRASALAVVSNPEIDAKRRAKKTESKAKAKKRKSASFAETKLRYGQKSNKRARPN